MTRQKTQPATEDRYEDIRDSLNGIIEQRPNYEATMSFHTDLENMFPPDTHVLMPIAAWHWDAHRSTHVILTPHTLPDGTRIHTAITRTQGRKDFLVMADSCTKPEGVPEEDPPHFRRAPSSRGTVTIYTSAPDRENLANIVDSVAKRAADIASTQP